MKDPLTFSQLRDDLGALLQLEPEELAGYIFALIQEAEFPEKETILYRGATSIIVLSDVPTDKREEVVLALTEAWQWLEREGLIIARPHSSGFTITRRGRRFRTSTDVRASIAAHAFPRGLLHPRLVQRVWGAVMRADYETAVFLAYREIEVAVREAAGSTATDIGVALMRRAFDKESGRLADPKEPEPEREALSHLFAGAVGRFKNPASHRSVEYTLVDTTEALVLASMLLRIVDERQGRST